MSGKRLVASSGKRIVSAAGKRLHLGTGCPCCGADPCSSACRLPGGPFDGCYPSCGGCTPKCFRWIVSGVSQCGGCVKYYAAFDQYLSVPAITLAGAKDLPFAPPGGGDVGCFWELVEDGPIVQVFSDDTCTTPVPIGDAGDGRFQSWIHYVHADYASFIILTTTDDGVHPDFNALLFRYTRASFGCAAETFANDLDTCGPLVSESHPTIATGGSITATPCCP